MNLFTDHERTALDRAVTDYYDSLSDAESKELAQWGKFAEKEFSPDETTLS